MRHKWSLLLLISLLACQPKPKTAPPLPFVSLLKAQETEVFEILAYPARVTSKVNAQILSEAQGIVSEVKVKLGQPIEAQGNILTITHTDPIYHYAPVRVLSPISGVVSAIDTPAGTYVKEGQVLGSILDPKQLEIQLEVPAQDLKHIYLGAKGMLKSPSLSETHAVEVSGVSPFVKPNSGTASARLRFITHPKGFLPPGLQGSVSFKIHSHKGILIPQSALLYRGQTPFVRILKDQVVEEVEVTIGLKKTNQVEIQSGVSVGDSIIERSSRSLSIGETVTVEKQAS